MVTKRKSYYRVGIAGGAWVVPLVECPTLAFSSGHDLTVCGIEPRIRLCSGFFLSLALSAPRPLAQMLSLKINKHLKKQAGIEHLKRVLSQETLPAITCTWMYCLCACVSPWQLQMRVQFLAKLEDRQTKKICPV